MKKLYFMLPLLIIAGLFLMEPIALANAQVIATTPAHDVTRVIYTGTGFSFSTGAYAPEIDIIEIDYALVGINGTITVKFEATPILSNHTYYWVTLTDPSSSFYAEAFFSGYSDTSSSDWCNATYLLMSGNGANSQTGTNTTDVIQGTSLVFTFPGQWADSSNIWNSTIDASWTWSVYSWEWIGTSKTNTNVGTWYHNYYPTSNDPFNIYNTNTSSNTSSGASSSTKASPGFELITAIVGFFVVIPLYLYKRNKNE